MIRPEVVQQLSCPVFGLATSWVISRKGEPVESLQEVQSQFRREWWPFPATVSKKDNSIAKALREKANDYYKREPSESDKVLRMYNQSISHAVPGSEEIGMGYANRSAVYFNRKEYQRCVLNIELAKKNNYPSSKMAKLVERESRCKKFLGLVIDHEENESYTNTEPFNLRVTYNQQCKKGITATTNFNVGEIVFSESPSLIVLEPEVIFHRCGYCGRENGSDLIPCDVCYTSMYCSEACRNKASSSYHHFECEIMENLKHLFKGPKTTRMFYLSLRLFWMVLSDLGTDPDSFRQHLSDKFKRFLNPLPLESNKIHLHVLATDLPDMSKDRTGEEVMQFLSVFIYKIAIEENASIRSNLREEDRSLLLEILHGLVLRAKAISDQSADDMTCLYPLLGMVNHSCAPNAERFMVDGKSILVAKRPIKAGEQILVCYIPDCTVETKEKSIRQSMLQKEFNIDCQCLGCSLDHPMLSEVEEDFELKDKLKGIMDSDGVKLKLLEDFMQNHDEQYPKKELFDAWKAYRDEKIKHLCS